MAKKAPEAPEATDVLSEVFGRLPFAVLLVLSPFILGAIIALGPLLIMVSVVVVWVWAMNWAKNKVFRSEREEELEVA